MRQQTTELSRFKWCVLCESSLTGLHSRCQQADRTHHLKQDRSTGSCLSLKQDTWSAYVAVLPMMQNQKRRASILHHLHNGNLCQQAQQSDPLPTWHVLNQSPVLLLGRTRLPPPYCAPFWARPCNQHEADTGMQAPRARTLILSESVS